MDKEKMKEQWGKVAVWLKTYVLNKYVIICIGFAFLITFCGDHCLINYVKRYHKEKELTKERKGYQDAIKQDEQAIENLQSNKENLERFARERYQMKVPGEDVYLVEEDE